MKSLLTKKWKLISWYLCIGDAVTYPGKMQLIATGFGEAPIAVNEALEYLYPHQKHRIHSTDLYH